MSIGKLAITTKEMLSNEAIAHFIISEETRLSTEYVYCFFDYFKFNALEQHLQLSIQSIQKL